MGAAELCPEGFGKRPSSQTGADLIPEGILKADTWHLCAVLFFFYFWAVSHGGEPCSCQLHLSVILYTGIFTMYSSLELSQNNKLFLCSEM